MSACATCGSPERAKLEALGSAALRGEMSWREAARQGDLSHHAGLKAHMVRHVVSAEVAEQARRHSERAAAERAVLAENARLRALVKSLRYTVEAQSEVIRALREAGGSAAA